MKHLDEGLSWWYGVRALTLESPKAENNKHGHHRDGWLFHSTRLCLTALGFAPASRLLWSQNVCRLCESPSDEIIYWSPLCGFTCKKITFICLLMICIPCQHLVDYGNSKIIQHAQKKSSKCWSWTQYRNRSRRDLNFCIHGTLPLGEIDVRKRWKRAIREERNISD